MLTKKYCCVSGYHTELGRILTHTVGDNFLEFLNGIIAVLVGR